MRQTSKYLKGLAREALLQRYSTAVGAYLILFLFTLFQYLLPMREFDTLKFKKAPQSLETGLFFCQLFLLFYIVIFSDM